MKRIASTIAIMLISLLVPLSALAAGDLVLNDANVRLSTQILLEGKIVRIYATVVNVGVNDLRGFVRFYDANRQISSDQPISVIAGKDDAVFVDWELSPGDHDLRVVLVPYEQSQDNPNNNAVSKKLIVFADTDRDGIPNKDDPDDDNDGVSDDADLFPLNKNESIDSDGDGIGNTADEDDDNDGILDTADQVPLNANETIDTDKDGIGNNEDGDDDGDGLTDIEEAKIGTDPLKPDTDGDTVNDLNDLFPLDATQATDFDKDGVSDTKDTDADNDGKPKSEDINDTNLGPQIRITSQNQSARRIIYPNEIVQFETTTSVDPDGKIEKIEWFIANASEGDEKKSGESPSEKIAPLSGARGGGSPTYVGEGALLAPTIEGSSITRQFSSLGKKTIHVVATDDKGEKTEKTFSVLVVPRAAPWIFVTTLLLILILAIYSFFSYSKRRP